MRRVRHVYAARDEHVVVHRNHSDFGGCLGLLLLPIFFWMMSAAATILILVVLGFAAFGLACWRGGEDLGMRGSGRRFLASFSLALVAAGLGTYVLHSNIIDWATTTTTETTGSLWWKKSFTKTHFDADDSKLYHILSFLAIWGNGYAIISMIYEMITEAQRKKVAIKARLDPFA